MTNIHLGIRTCLIDCRHEPSTMGTTMDPRVLAIMAQFEKEEKKAAEKPKEEVKFKPPTNLEEFMKVEALKEWPQRLTSEGILDIRSEADLFGNQEDLAAILREAARILY
ncbi:hypothetical protein KUTeg_017638 [Tegillarca granosa]|uniref:Uncharacterized protein n=1 Tax=Tegillarca granosa TaxID=220873 RepID=A0ABQ9EFU3_TEGGR|nr:hypothetical protein KUTeg_017638 [Tegillarca granosa]